MKSRFVPFVLTAAFVMTPAVLSIGCDKEVAHDKTVEQKSDGTSKSTEKTVKEKPDGSTVTTEEKKVDNKPDGK